ncbi:MAG: hypothetical protein IIC61_08540 [Proteobacteria bacterium]|nr:hypothetical protein [Pseudomonadota bacterium]
MKDKLQITAYEVIEDPMPLRPAERARQWMEDTVDRFAYRCLPVAMANQVGWDILCPVAFTARWNGKAGLKDINLKFHGKPSALIGSHFGHGVLTFSPGYLFRTTRSHNLWVKGPTNCPKDGIAPLEGLIETDWAPFSFTMNWKFTRARHKVRFELGEPICRIIPYPRHYIRKFEPKIKNINENAKLYQQYVEWRESRLAFNEGLKEAGSDAAREKWQRDYMKGQDQKGNTFAGHETKIQVKDFKRT